jgi:hypothetical protein
MHAVTISNWLLWRLVGETPHEDGRPTFFAAQFNRATFHGEAAFVGATFQDRTAQMTRDTYSGSAA